MSAPYQPHSDTSREAAERIAPHAARMRDQVEAFVKAEGGATREEIAAALEINYGSLNGRIAELQAEGVIRDSEARRKSKSGRRMVVYQWVAPGLSRLDALRLYRARRRCRVCVALEARVATLERELREARASAQQPKLL